MQDLAVTLYNCRLYWIRRSGRYAEFRKYYADAENLSHEQLVAEAGRRLDDFLEFATTHSTWYAAYDPKQGLSAFPVLEKEDLRLNLDAIATLNESSAMASYTGGTTGASLRVLFTRESIQERFAILDHFRSKFGYKLGNKVAWFGSRSLVTERDVAKGRCYHDDLFNRIRFFSTFHLSASNFHSYWKALCSFQPEYIVGYPSTIYELAKSAEAEGLKFPGRIRTVFTTSETIQEHHRKQIQRVFGCRVVDQYASSEGAPFILECEAGRMHMHPLTGVFEVVDDQLRPSREGELLVTSFTTLGTPLIRYRIGDRIRLADPDYQCDCGSSFPLIDHIEGRTVDFIWSEDGAKINQTTIANAARGIQGIRSFQISQFVKSKIEVSVVTSAGFDCEQEEAFREALIQRLGERMEISFHYVDHIPRESSGKFRLIRNLSENTG